MIQWKLAMITLQLMGKDEKARQVDGQSRLGPLSQNMNHGCLLFNPIQISVEDGQVLIKNLRS